MCINVNTCQSHCTSLHFIGNDVQWYVRKCNWLSKVQFLRVFCVLKYSNFAVFRYFFLNISVYFYQNFNIVTGCFSAVWQIILF